MTEALDLPARAPAETDLVWPAIVGAALARQGRVTARASLALGIAAIGLGVVLVRVDPHRATSMIAALTALQVALLAYGLLFAIRTAFDADLLAALALRPDVEGFDRAMTDLSLMPGAKAGRPMAARIAGVKRLMRWQSVGVGLQLMALLGLVAVGAPR